MNCIFYRKSFRRNNSELIASGHCRPCCNSLDKSNIRGHRSFERRIQSPGLADATPFPGAQEICSGFFLFSLTWAPPWQQFKREKEADNSRKWCLWEKTVIVTPVTAVHTCPAAEYLGIRMDYTTKSHLGAIATLFLHWDMQNRFCITSQGRAFSTAHHHLSHV